MTAYAIRPLSSPEMIGYREQQHAAAAFVGSKSDSNIDYFYNHDDSFSSQSSKILPPSQENCQTINNNIETPCKYVRFAPTCTIKHMLSHRDMTTKEKQNTWIQEDEADSIIRKCRNVIDVVERAGGRKIKIVGSGRKGRICTRGLESGMRMESLRKQACRLKGIEKVFIAQQQEVECSSTGGYYKYDDEAIAAVYKSVTNDCRIRAERVALHDRKQAVRYNLRG